MYMNKYVNQGGEDMPEYKVWRIVSALCLLITIINVLTNIRFRILEKRVSTLETTITENLDTISKNQKKINELFIGSGDSKDVDK